MTVALGIVAYWLIAVVVGVVVARLSPRDHKGPYVELGAMVGLLWPVGVPILLFVVVVDEAANWGQK